MSSPWISISAASPACRSKLRACVANYDAATGRYTLHAGSGGAVRQKNELASILGIKPDSLRVLSFDVGGNFGTRNRVYPEYGLVLWASRKLGRPVKFLATRSECFISDYQGRDLVTKLELALDGKGRFLALRATNISNAGARCVSLSPLSKGAGLITGNYAIPAATLRAVSVYTNTIPTQAYRSSGRPEVTFAIERLIDIAAEKLAIDRISLRRRNLVRPKAMPYRNAVGMTYDSGRYEENMDLAMRIADWDGFKARRREAKKRGKLLGLGLANYVESSIGAPKEQARITIKPEGRVDVIIGTQPAGQGHETSFAQVVSDLLQVPLESISIIMGDTDVVRAGGGSHSGRSMRHAATVFSIAATDLIAKGKRIAALALGTTPDRVEFNDGRFAARETNRSFDFLELAQEIPKLALPDDLAGGLAVVADNEMHDPVFPNGCAICEIEIDPDSGALTLTRYASVDDVGRCINPLIVDGQTHGAITQGIGQALWEQFVVDDSGQPLTGSLMDYGMPRAHLLPSFRTEIVEVLSPTNPLGIKAGGEGGTTAAPAVIVSALVDALKPYGILHIDMPATPYRIWQTIQNAKTLKLPIRRQHAAGAPAPDIILPQFVDVARAIEVAGELFELACRERHDRAETRGIMHRLRVLHEMNAVDQRGRHALRHHHLPVGADQQAVMLAERARQRAAFLGVADVARIGMHRNAARPAHRVVLHRLELDALRQREGRGQIVMEMRDGMDIGAGSENLAMQIDFRWRLHAGRACDHLAIEIADQEIAGPNLRAALVERLNEQRLASG